MLYHYTTNLIWNRKYNKDISIFLYRGYYTIYVYWDTYNAAV